MALMAWSSHFVTGIESVDAQHKGLVDLINAAAPHLALTGEEPARDARPLLDRLAQYAVTHFELEEGLMSEGRIDAGYLAEHRRSHSAFAQEVTQMIDDASADNNVSGTDLLRFLSSWLTFHILSEDQCMARQLRAIETGMSPQAALDTAPPHDPSANAVLNSALLDLFSLLTQRNQTLKSLNEKLRQAQAELARSNEQLEARVAKRTGELSKANEDLGREREALIESLAQLKHTQSQLLQSEKMAAVGQLAAGVAHEINNPIGFVTANFSSLNTYTGRLFSLIDAYAKLEATLPADHPLRPDLTRTQKLVELDYLRQDIPDLLRESSEGLARVKRIVSDLQDFSRIEASQWLDADINHLLESSLNVIWSEPRPTVEVIRAFGELPPVRCVPAQISQAFMSLLVNAAQAIETSGIITLRTRAENDSVRIEIADTGQGISEEVQQRMFEPFFTTKPLGKGTGLGLSIAWDIIQHHNGHIEVKSCPGAGSTFVLTLPTGLSRAGNIKAGRHG